MQRATAFFSMAALVAVYAACAKQPTPFHQMRTPSGDFCSDMPIYAGLTQPEREFHRIGPVRSQPKLNSPAERLESLRKAACGLGADAIVEAAEAEERQVDATHSMIASGTAVIWTRRPDTEARPLGLGSVSGTAPEGEFKEAAPPPTAKEVTPLNTGGEVKTTPTTTTAATTEPTPTATATTPPTPSSTTTTKTTTKTKTKTK